MERLPDGVVFEVLTCLSACDIASLVSCDRFLLSMATSMSCLSTRQRYVRPVSDATAYTKNLLLGPMAGTLGSVTCRPRARAYRSFFVRKLILQCLLVQGERDAAKWLASTSYAMVVPRSSSLVLFRHVHWDFLLYTILCNALERCASTSLALNVKSVPAIVDKGERLPISSHAFLYCLLRAASTQGPQLTLGLCGASHESPYVPLFDGFFDTASRRVDDVFREDKWWQSMGVYSLQDFRSSTVALGRALATANPRLRALTVSCYVFDEMAPSQDVSLLSSYLRWGGVHGLVRVNFHHLQFMSGSDFCCMVKALCKIPSLQHVRLSGVDCLVDPPEDPLAIFFHEGAHIQDLRLRDVARVPANVPFHLLKSPGYRCLALSQMFLDASNLEQLLPKLPSLQNLVCVDVSCNGIDGSVLGLFANVLRKPECKIKRLNLASNIITGSAMPFFCRALAVNRSLENLDVRDNFLGTQNSLTLLETVLRGSRITYLNVDGNQVRYRMQDLCRILLASGSSGSLRQVSLKANPCLATDHDEDAHEYKTFFKTQYNISFLF